MKGAIFEILVKKLLEKNEYEPCKTDNEQVDDKGRVRGRNKEEKAEDTTWKMFCHLSSLSFESIMHP